MDALRELATQEGMVDVAPRIKLFEKLFLDSVRRYGRLYEFGTLARYNLLSGRPFQDIDLIFPLLAKGKLTLKPTTIKNMAQLQRIFSNLNQGQD